MADPLERLRAELRSRVPASCDVSGERRQYWADEDSAFFTEIDVQRDGGFVLAVVRSRDPERDDAFRRTLHCYAFEVWLVDVEARRVFVSSIDRVPRVRCIGDTLTCDGLPSLAIPVAALFD